MLLDLDGLVPSCVVHPKGAAREQQGRLDLNLDPDPDRVYPIHLQLSLNWIQPTHHHPLPRHHSRSLYHLPPFHLPTPYSYPPDILATARKAHLEVYWRTIRVSTPTLEHIHRLNGLDGLRRGCLRACCQGGLVLKTRNTHCPRHSQALKNPPPSPRICLFLGSWLLILLHRPHLVPSLFFPGRPTPPDAAHTRPSARQAARVQPRAPAQICVEPTELRSCLRLPALFARRCGKQIYSSLFSSLFSTPPFCRPSSSHIIPPRRQR